MSPPSEYTPLDDLDRGILQLLQRDARNLTAVDLAEKVGTSDGTVRNRIRNLEKRGIVEGYVPIVDYEAAGYPLQLRIMCSAPIVEREQLAEEAIEVAGVVEVHEVMTGRNNVEVKAVATRHDDLTRIATTLDSMGLEVESEELIRHHYFRPFDHFGTENLNDGGDEKAVHGI